MNYEAFRAAWTYALTESRLPRISFEPTETLDLRTLERSYRIFVEPLGGQDAEPFHVTATLEWSWPALQTARSNGDGDVLTEMLGRDRALDLESEKSCVRIDIKLKASAPYGKPLPFPSETAWAAWVRETLGRLERIEPLIPDEDVRINRMGMLEVLAWRTEPKAIVVCRPSGELALESVEVAAGQVIELPRKLDGSGWKSPDSVDRGNYAAIDSLLASSKAMGLT